MVTGPEYLAEKPAKKVRSSCVSGSSTSSSFGSGGEVGWSGKGVIGVLLPWSRVALRSL